MKVFSVMRSSEWSAKTLKGTSVLCTVHALRQILLQYRGGSVYVEQLPVDRQTAALSTAVSVHVWVFDVCAACFERVTMVFSNPAKLDYFQDPLEGYKGGTEQGAFVFRVLAG